MRHRPDIPEPIRIKNRYLGISLTLGIILGPIIGLLTDAISISIISCVVAAMLIGMILGHIVAKSRFPDFYPTQDSPPDERNT